MAFSISEHYLYKKVCKIMLKMSYIIRKNNKGE